jgi:peptide/nickel transport system substrate-binding protein
MWMLGWGSDNGDPDNFIGWHFIHPMGEPKAEDCYNNDELTQLLIDGAKEPDEAKREAMYQRAEELVHQDMPRLPIVWPAGRTFLRKDVKGYEPIPFKQWYHLVSIEEE